MSGTTNLLEETRECLKSAGKEVTDVLWVGSPDFGYTTWDNFAAVADVEYDAGYGAQEVATDLLVVGDDWWLEREEYDGSEGWALKSPPTRPLQQRNLAYVTVNQSPHGQVGWESLTAMHRAGSAHE